MVTKTNVSTLIAVCALGLNVQTGFATEILLASANKIPVLSSQSKVGNVVAGLVTVSNTTGEELFGKEGGYFHPYVSAGYEYTDNLYKVNDTFPLGDTSNSKIVISPGIWYATPRTKNIPITINPNNTSPGGLQYQLEDGNSFDRFQAYALGGLDFNFYSEDSDLNNTDGELEGLLRYNMPTGLGLQLVDRYTKGEDDFNVSTAARDQEREFYSNLFMATADWSITEKLRTKLDYTNFYLSYDDEINRFLDRTDNGVDLYGYFTYSPKTDLFLQYQFVRADYDESTRLDSDSNFFYGGLEWDATGKTELLAKIGYQTKSFDNALVEKNDFDGFVYQLRLRYNYSEKTRLQLASYRTNEAADVFGASDQTVLGVAFRYDQKFTDKLSGSFDFIYEDIEYSNVDIITQQDRDDDTFTARPALQYLFRRWLMFELAYEYEKRDSNEDIYEYDVNTFMFNANFSL